MNEAEKRMLSEMNESEGRSEMPSSPLPDWEDECPTSPCIHQLVISEQYHDRAIEIMRKYYSPQGVAVLELCSIIGMGVIFATESTPLTSAYVGVVTALYEQG